jgi:uncharacterized membrane protein YqjE
MLKDSLLKLVKLDGLVNSLTGYIEARLDLFKYEIKEDVAQGVANALVFLLLALLAGLVIAFTSTTVALLIGEHLGNAAGFACVAGFYLLLTLLLLAFRKPITHRLEARVKQLLKK